VGEMADVRQAIKKPCGYPSFDEPEFTVPAGEAFADGVLPGVPEQTPLPELIEAPAPPVLDPIDEPMVRVEHQRIRTLCNYWHAGWSHAVPGTWLRQSVADRLAAVADGLPPRWGLAVFDAWRPIELQKQMYEAAYADPDSGIEPGFLAFPSEDPARPPPHLTGGTVDVTLTYDWLPLALGCGFDDTTAAAHADRFERTPGVDRELRRLLFWAMRAEGFVVFAGEWWHFEHGTSRWSLVTGAPPRYGPTTPPCA